MVDSGNNLNLFPSELASSINSAFDPPASHLDHKAGANTVACNATAPALSIEIGNATFEVDPRDMIWRDAQGTCFSSVVSTDVFESEGVLLNVLGDVFFEECPSGF